jgi:hypothetical protein
MTQFSNLKCLVADPGGTDLEHAVRLGKDFGKVYYYTPWQKQGPLFLDYAIGEGIEQIENEKKFWARVDSVDLVVFCDIGFGDWARYLRSHGYRVFGGSEELEEDRFLVRREQMATGMPTQRYEKVRGVSGLRKFAAGHKEWWVKLPPHYRGIIETFQIDKDGKAEMKINHLAVEFGPFGGEIDFMCEEPLEGLEPGFDTFYSKAGWTFPCMWGLGTVDYGYLATFTNYLPEILQNHMSKMTKILKNNDYNGPISTEVKTKDGQRGYMLDITCRYLSPGGLIYTEVVKNYSEVIWKVAGAEPVTIVPTAKYVGCVWLPTNYTEKAWDRLVMEPKDRNRVKFQRAAKQSGRYYAVKGEENGFVILGLGKSLQEVVGEIKDVSERVHIQDLYKGGVGQLEKSLERVKEAKKIGLEL